jgi:uncharacterized membrane protein
MVAVDTQGGRAARSRSTHPEEWLSMLMSLGATVLVMAFLWLAPSYQPTSGVVWSIPGWIGFIYLFVQMLLLLVSATQIRVLGVLDSIISIFPFVAALVTTIEWILGHLPLSLFQLNALAIMLAASLGEFLLTIWVRFVVNRRTIGIDAN